MQKMDVARRRNDVARMGEDESEEEMSIFEDTTTDKDETTQPSSPSQSIFYSMTCESNDIAAPDSIQPSSISRLMNDFAGFTFTEKPSSPTNEDDISDMLQPTPASVCMPLHDVAAPVFLDKQISSYRNDIASPHSLPSLTDNLDLDWLLPKMKESPPQLGMALLPHDIASPSRLMKKQRENPRSATHYRGDWVDPTDSTVATVNAVHSTTAAAVRHAELLLSLSEIQQKLASLLPPDISSVTPTMADYNKINNKTINGNDNGHDHNSSTKKTLFQPKEVVLTVNEERLCTVERLIGRGGMGEVYLVDVDGQPLAMKCLSVSKQQKPQHQQQQQQQQHDKYKTTEEQEGVDNGYKELLLSLLAETETLLTLGKHPNIAQVMFAHPYFHDKRDATAKSSSLLHAHQSFLLFIEYVEGGSLADAIKSGGLYNKSHGVNTSLLGLCIQLAEGIQHIHNSGVVHQDLKPDNILLTTSGVPKITDYGTSQTRQAQRSQQPASQINCESATELPVADCEETIVVNAVGATPAYWSPEQASVFLPESSQVAVLLPSSSSVKQIAEPKLTRKTDIYSWALTVLQIYSKGRFWKWGHKGEEILNQYLNRLTQAQEQPLSVPLPDGLEPLLRQCLAVNPLDRPQSFDAIIRDLKAIYANQNGTDYQPMESVISAARHQETNIIKSYTNLGGALRNWKLYDESIRVLKKALPSVQAKSNLALTYMEMNEYLLARQMFEEILEQAPLHQASYANYSQLLYEQGEFKQAITVLKNGLTHFPNDWLIHNNLAVALLGNDETVDSETALESVRHAYLALKHEPLEPAYWDSVGHALLKANREGGQKSVIKHCLERALVLNPTLARAYMNLSQTPNLSVNNLTQCFQSALHLAVPPVVVIDSTVYHTSLCDTLADSLRIDSAKVKLELRKAISSELQPCKSCSVLQSNRESGHLGSAKMLRQPTLDPSERTQVRGYVTFAPSANGFGNDDVTLSAGPIQSNETVMRTVNATVPSGGTFDPVSVPANDEAATVKKRYDGQQSGSLSTVTAPETHKPPVVKMSQSKLARHSPSTKQTPCCVCM